MTENPYESPKTPPESRAARAPLVAGALMMLAVPSAAIAGGSVCSATFLFGDGEGLLLPMGIAAGIPVAAAVLCVAHYVMRRQKPEIHEKPRYGLALLGLLLATPVAVGAGTGVVFLTMFAGGEGTIPVMIFATGFAAFLMWSLGFWLGLRWRRKVAKS
jgi:hypothetical protein